MEALEVNGTQPDLVGKRCEEMIALEYWHEGKLVDPANVVHLNFDGDWHLLYFDSGIVFWRDDTRVPESFEAPEIDASYRAFDLAEVHALRGAKLTSLEAEPIEAGSQVRFGFEGDKQITFRNVRDVSTYSVP